MREEPTIIFLYSRLPDYFYQCVRFFVIKYPCKAIIVRHRDDMNTKYSFKNDEKISLYYKDEVNIAELISQVNPVALILSGWNDKTYTAVAGKYRTKIPVVLAMDNPWYGTIKQHILARLARLSIRRIFNKMWVTGSSQREYASRLGFDNNNIIKDLYAADCDKFYRQAQIISSSRTEDYPRTIVYVGRMVEYKQPHLLAEVFHEIVSTMHTDWKLILSGEGPLKETIRNKNYKQVEVKDFVNPSDLPQMYTRAGVFVLPSISEHWGVAVHEAAAAGLPLLLSDSVESGTQFLVHGFNGYRFITGDRESLKKHMVCLMKMPVGELYKMGENSMMLSKTISHATWAANLNSILIDK